MAVIPLEYLNRLRAAGLRVSDPFEPNHIAFPDGVQIAKPASVAGHSLPDFAAYWCGDEGLELLDAPGLWLHCHDGTWFVTSHNYVPGPGPGDFVDKWPTAEEAVADVLDFYFGSSARIDIKRDAQR